jgi:hypothetical protein
MGGLYQRSDIVTQRNVCEIEITPTMIDAGAEALLDVMAAMVPYEPGKAPDVAKIYRAMEAARQDA